jgi:succinoglycan biosynthesis transport protein ExoP
MKRLEKREPTPRERLNEVRQTLGKRRGLILRCALLALFTIGLATYFVTPEFEAKSSVYVRLDQAAKDSPTDASGALSSRMGAVSPLAVLNSYTETILSRSTAEQVVRGFKLDQIPPSQAFRERVKDGIIGAITGVISSVSKAMAGKAANDTGEDKFRKTVDDLQSNIAAEVDEETELVLITVEYPDPALSQKINQRLIDILAQRSLNMSRAETEAAHRAVTASIPAAKEKMEEADRALAAFKREHGIVALTEEQRVRIARLDALESQADQAKAAREENEAKLEAARADLKNRSHPVTLTTVVAENPTVRQTKADLYAKESELAGRLQTYTEEHPEVVRLKAEIEAAHERLRREVERAISTETKGLPPEYAPLVQNLVALESDQMGLVARERAAAETRQAFKAQLESLPAVERELEQLGLEQRIATGLYTDLVSRSRQLQSAAENPTPSVSMAVIDPPRLPKGISDISSPPYLIVIILGPILALLLALTVAFVAEYFDDSLGTAEEVAATLELPVLTVVPYTRQLNGVGRRPFPAPRE